MSGLINDRLYGLLRAYVELINANIISNVTEAGTLAFSSCRS